MSCKKKVFSVSVLLEKFGKQIHKMKISDAKRGIKHSFGTKSLTIH